MVAILSKNNVNLFISYGPGTGSTALEQHLRTCCRHIEDMGFRVEHLPVEDFGINSSISRHICYSDFLRKFGRSCDYVATGIRNPFNYYYSEYKRIKQKWMFLLDDQNSWIYNEESTSTRQLALSAKNTANFDSWLYDILFEAKTKGYLAINEDHMDMATHFIRSENMNVSFDIIIENVFGVRILEYIGIFPVVNKTILDQECSGGISLSTLNLGLDIFGHYMSRFGYSFEESDLFLT